MFVASGFLAPGDPRPSCALATANVVAAARAADPNSKILRRLIFSFSLLLSGMLSPSSMSYSFESTLAAKSQILKNVGHIGKWIVIVFPGCGLIQELTSE